MRRQNRFPLGVLFSALAAFVFAAPTLFLPADTHVAIKLFFIVTGCLLFAAGILFVRREGRAREKRARKVDGVTPQ